MFSDGGDPHKQGDCLAVRSRHNNTMFKRGFIMEKQMSNTSWLLLGCESEQRQSARAEVVEILPECVVKEH